MRAAEEKKETPEDYLHFKIEDPFQPDGDYSDAPPSMTEVSDIGRRSFKQ